MPIIATGAQDALVIAVRSVTGGRRPTAGRLRVTREVRVVHGVCRPAELRELAAMLREGRPLHAGPAPVSPLGTLRDALEDAVSTVLGDVEVHSEIELRSTPPGTTADRGPGPDPAGWRTALRFMLLVEVPPGAAWTLHTPGRDVTVDRPGSLVVHGADVASSWHQSVAPAPVVTCSARTMLRRGRRTTTVRRSA